MQNADQTYITSDPIKSYLYMQVPLELTGVNRAEGVFHIVVIKLLRNEHNREIT